jgi:hypothetical protein
VANERLCGEWTLAFWDGPGADELAEYFAYTDLSGKPEGKAIPWHVYLGEVMWTILSDWGYEWRG